MHTLGKTSSFSEKFIDSLPVLWIRGNPVAKATHYSVGRSNMFSQITQLSKSGNMIKRKYARFVLIIKNQFLLKIVQNNSGNQEMIWATQFFTVYLGGPVGDPWIWVYPQHWFTILLFHLQQIGVNLDTGLTLSICMKKLQCVFSTAK